MIVVDVETTGLEPEVHSIVSIGALDFSNQTNQFYEECRVWGNAEIDKQSLEINGFTEDEIKNPSGKKSLEKTIKEFLEWREKIQDKTLAGHNVYFDARFLKNSAARFNIQIDLGYRFVDLHSLCYADHIKRDMPVPMKDGKTGMSLDYVLGYVGLPKRPQPHNALEGAKLEAEAFSRFISNRKLFQEYSKFGIPEYLSS